MDYVPGKVPHPAVTTDALAELGQLFLGSRLKRLAERFQADAAATLQAMAMPMQPAQQLLLATLHRRGPATVGALAEQLRISQPTVTRTVLALREQRLIATSRKGRDQRHKTVALTTKGRALITRAERDLWPRVEGAVAEMCAGLKGSFLDQIAMLETELDKRSLAERVSAAKPVSPGLTIRDFDDELAEAFYRINAEWIEEMFTLEDNDLALMSNPRELIIDKGGIVLFAETPDLGVVGTCALMKMGDGCYELTKMGVLKAARGRKVGEYLLAKTLERAKLMGIEQLYLLTNKKCEAAIHLYEKLGFEHDGHIMATYGTRYERCNVAMSYSRL
ncbi:MAG TPA: bifunctional helix-turn-helix transcriptional regulator/GNAT family N-acetyltransferase [Rhizomicrobium sp.]|nr:bifunctional helix-turn-helix transcriptional regulator/GNAT family N-acetyltransferase [Rhizomicrobium sp.]